MSDVVLHPEQAVVRFMQPTDADREALDRCNPDPALLLDDGFDYSRVVVRKPWGYEYLMFQNDEVAVWILRLVPGASTSLHCHLRKTTSLAVLSGEACCRSMNHSVTRKPGEGLVIGPAVFHQTTALSRDGVFLMEIETPVNKRDLVRLSDAYGRSGLGYETAEHMTANTANYNRLSFLGDSIFYNTRKRFRDTTVRIARSAGPAALADVVQAAPGDLVGVLRGEIVDEGGTIRASPGQFIDPTGSALRVTPGFEALIVSYRDRRARLADIIVGDLRARGISTFFLSPGTTNAHLVDAIAREGEGAFIPQTSDSAAAQAAVAYAKLAGKPACCVLSAGASAASAIGSVADAWMDSAPVLFLCAHTRQIQLPAMTRGLRQLANKEFDGARLVRSITKYAKRTTDALNARADLSRAVDQATNGRAGPSWIDLPIDLLGQCVDEAEIAPATRRRTTQPRRPAADQIFAVLELVQRSHRPALLLGQGVRAAGAEADALELARHLDWPILTTRRGVDLVAATEPRLIGRPGTYGSAAANEVVRSCDLLLCVGARLELPLVGRNFSDFAPLARMIVVDTDRAELAKPTISPEIAIHADAGEFMRALRARLQTVVPEFHAEWLRRCQMVRDERLLQPNAEAAGLDPFAATRALSRYAPQDAVIIAEGGAPLDYVMREWAFGSGQRLIAATGSEGDAFALASAVGAAFAAPNRRIVCLCEAGAFLRSTPELATLLERRLPVTIVLYCAADDYRVRDIQARYFGERHVAPAPQHELAQRLVERCLRDRGCPVEIADDLSAVDRVLGSAFPPVGPSVCVFTLADDARIATGPKYAIRGDGQWEVAQESHV